MQNNVPPYQGSMSQGSFSDHTYDNNMGAHCPPSGYQPYVNGPYPISPSPGHHYENHHLQHTGMYRPNYTPIRNRYRPPPNQDVYRNHRSAYAGSNNQRHYTGKPVWCDSNQSEVIPSYNHTLHHPPMMNSAPMNMPSMRPSHMSPDVHSVQSVGSHHYRPMQSPGQPSAQSWSHSQTPNQNIHNTARTTPSPLQCSPHHSQQFSPSAASHMPGSSNVLSHSIPSTPNESSHSSSAAVAQEASETAIAGPLHSLQKMVMLEEENIGKLNQELSNDICDSQAVHTAESIPMVNSVSDSELKDSSFATYLNLDENRVESEPQNETAKPVGFPPLVSIKAITPDSDVKIGMSDSCEIVESSIPQVHVFKESSQTFDLVCPPTSLDDPINVANCKSSEQMVEGNPILSAAQPIAGSLEISPSVSDDSSKTQSTLILSHVSDNVADEQPSTNESPGIEIRDCFAAAEGSKNACEQPVDSVPKNLLISENTANVEKVNLALEDSGPVVTSVSCKEEKEQGTENSQTLHEHNQSNAVPDSVPIIKEEKCEGRPSIVKLTPASPNMKVNFEVNGNSSEENAVEPNEYAEPNKNLDGNIADNPAEKMKLNVCENIDSGTIQPNVQTKHKLMSIAMKALKRPSENDIIDLADSDDSSSGSVKMARNAALEAMRNPVKVVIHRIRKSDTNDTWHVPNSNDEISLKVGKENERKAATETAGDTKSDVTKKTLKIGPQIIMLTPAMPRKKLNCKSNNSKSVLIAKPSNPNAKVSRKKNLQQRRSRAAAKPCQSRKKLISNSSSVNNENSFNECPDNFVSKKKGRPVGSQNKSKNMPVKRKCKGKKKGVGSKKSTSDEVEAVSKHKKLKPFIGPYVHIMGSKQAPSAITVINVAIKEDTKGKKPVQVKSSTTDNCTPKRSQVGHASTLSPNYDAFNTDVTWVCAFCRKGSHHSGLGDLYGPYYVKDDTLDESSHKKLQSRRSSTSRSSRGKRRRSDASITDFNRATPKKPKQTSKPVTPTSSKESATKSTEDEIPKLREIWIHEDCAVWCQNISLMGSHVQGLQEAVLEAKENVCSHCKINGATLGCWWKSCKEQFHFTCAKEKCCQLNYENFSLYCPQHKNMKVTGRQKRSSS